jgi:hypothetical protein
MEELVDAAITLHGMGYRMTAARLLCEFGVSFRLTVRVLAEPERRRRKILR